MVTVGSGAGVIVAISFDSVPVPTAIAVADTNEEAWCYLVVGKDDGIDDDSLLLFYNTRERVT